MKHCIICGKLCKAGAKYCISCSSILRDNRTKASNLTKKTGYKHCPLCFNKINKEQAFCHDCTATLRHNKQILFPFNNEMKEDNNNYLELEYTYIIKSPRFYRKNRKDYVEYKVIELGLKTGYIFNQNLEILYKEGLPKRNRFQGKEKYFTEYIVPIARKQYERWRLNAIGFGVDVAVETILNGKKIEDAKD